MKPIRSISPKVQNNYVNNYYQSPNRKQINIINIDNDENVLNKRINNNNKLNLNKNNYNYYEEITKAFNFITFVLKQKDSQIHDLRLKIKDLEKQLKDINDTNIMTFNNQEIITNSSKASNLNILKNNKNFNINNNNNMQKNINLMSPNSEHGKNMAKLNNLLSTQIDCKNNNNYNNNNIINIYKNNNFVNEMNNNNINNKIFFDNKMNIIHKIKNTNNINQINNYRNDITGLGKNNVDYNKMFINDDIQNKSFNLNINEHSSEKKNINTIRKESYHSNQNINVNIKNMHGSAKDIKNKNSEHLNFATESENTIEQSKLKIVSLEKFSRPGSKNNSFNSSDDGNTITSKNDVKNYLKEVKHKLEPNRFKKFITQIKALTKNKNNEQKNLIILQIKNILIDKNLINKFEAIMKVNKN